MSAKHSAAHLSLATYLAMGLRNLGRHVRRTLLMLTSLIVGIAAITFLIALNDGWLTNLKDSFILTYYGHVQVHAAGFEDTRQIKRFMPDAEAVIASLKDMPGIKGVSRRVRTSGLASTAEANSGVLVMGVDVEAERHISRLADFVREGAWLKADDARGLLLGQTLVERLQVRLGDKVVLMAQAANGDIASEVFRLRGVLASGAMDVDDLMAVVPLATVQHWLELDRGVTDIVVRAERHGLADAIQAGLKQRLGDGYEVLRWRDIDPMIDQWLAFADAYIYVILLVVVAVVVAEILNTMLMSMHERVREFGLMQALGTRGRQIFFMLLIEALLLVAIGVVAGYLVGAACGLYFGRVGIDLSAFGSAFSYFYVSPILKPVVLPASAAKIVVTTLIAALIAGIYPAWKATRLNPVEALKHV